MKILHITTWYPNKFNSKEATWILDQINCLPPITNNKILHFEIFQSNNFRVVNIKDNLLSQTLISLPIKSWFVLELIYFIWLSYQLLVKRVHYKYDIVNFHIAYPMLTYWHWMKRFINKPIVITEHWSAYHFNFGVKKELPRIQKIFRQNIPVITVSQALARDIKEFAEAEFRSYILHNTVNENIFFHDSTVKRENFFFMVSQWKPPKNPFVVMEAFLEFNKTQNYVLKIGGYGQLWFEMQSWILEKNAEDQILLLGILDSNQIAHNMQRCKAFLHSSEYETFSVVCAEAVCCNTPVIASMVGGIKEVVNCSEGILIASMEVVSWRKAMSKIIRVKISDKPNRFSHESIGRRYYEILNEIIKIKNR